MRETMEFKGYIRENGMVASRNHVAILPSVVCANDVALGIANQVMNTRRCCTTRGAVNCRRIWTG